MKYVFLLFLFTHNFSYALSEPKAGKLCGGWFLAGRTELDDEVFFECVKTKKLGKKFVEAESRYKNARKLCAQKGWKNIKFCMHKMLAIPSRLAIQEIREKSGKNRKIASEE